MRRPSLFCAVGFSNRRAQLFSDYRLFAEVKRKEKKCLKQIGAQWGNLRGKEKGPTLKNEMLKRKTKIKTNHRGKSGGGLRKIVTCFAVE